MLEIDSVSASYGATQAVRNCSLTVPAGSIVTLLGANGAGKTTVLHVVAGYLPPRAGVVRFEGKPINGMAPEKIMRLGISLVPEHRQLFAEMTVEENLFIGRYIHGLGRGARQATQKIFDMFPELEPKRHAPAAMLSGGQQQMLAIGRALMAEPRMLLLDEPSLGLAPLMVDRILDTIAQINRTGVTVLLVEQNAYRTMPMSSYSYVMEVGQVALHGPSAELMADKSIQSTYLGTL